MLAVWTLVFGNSLHHHQTGEDCCHQTVSVQETFVCSFGCDHHVAHHVAQHDAHQDGQHDAHQDAHQDGRSGAEASRSTSRDAPNSHSPSQHRHSEHHCAVCAVLAMMPAQTTWLTAPDFSEQVSLRLADWSEAAAGQIMTPGESRGPPITA